MSWLRKNWFLVGIVVALVAGYLLRENGARLNPGGWTNRIIVFVMFLVTGLKLPTNGIVADLSSPTLHLFIQLFIFIVPTLLFLTARPRRNTILFRAEAVLKKERPCSTIALFTRSRCLRG